MRHGESVVNAEKIMCSSRSKEFRLTEKGIQEVHKSAVKLQKEGAIDVIFSSPLERTKETAYIVAGYFHIRENEVIIEEAIREQYFGTMEGKTSEEYLRSFKNPEDQYILAAPGGESGLEVYSRVAKFLDGLAEDPRYQNKTVLLVTHLYPAWQICKYFHHPLNEFFHTAETREFTLLPRRN
jgi:broad specificity phosphatase PhoE